MSQNWMRHFELLMFGGKEDGISLSDFKVTFSIERNDNRWPAVALPNWTERRGHLLAGCSGIRQTGRAAGMASEWRPCERGGQYAA